MDFFTAQDRARRQTQWLVIGFAGALIALTVAFYWLVWLIETLTPSQAAAGGYAVAPAFWDAKRLLWVAVGVVGIVGGASFVKVGQYRAGGGAVASSLGGRKVDATTRSPNERRLMNVVEEMSIASGVPVPEVYVLDDEPGINAFAAGYGPDEAAIAVSRGCLDLLSRDELQGVVAHEFSHILNGDMRLNLRLAGILFGLFVLVIIGRGFLHSMRFARVGGSNRKGGGGAVVAILLIGLAVFLLGMLGQFFGRLIQAAISRQREFLADASAVQFTRQPAGIRDALRRIGGSEVGSRVQHQQAEGLAHCFFSTALQSSFGGLFRTHPPLEQRIRQLDPRWDGSFLHQAAPPADEPSPRARTSPPVVPVAAAVVSAMAAAPVRLQGDAAQMEEVRRLRARVAAIDSRGIDDPIVAEAIVIGLFVEPGTSVDLPWNAVEQALSHPVRKRVEEWRQSLLDELPRAHRLPLFELALPALREMDRAAILGLFEATAQLVHADQVVSLYEFILELLLRHRLESTDERLADRRAYYKHPRALAEPLSRVLSLLAMAATHEDPGQARTLVEGTVAGYEGWATVSFRVIDRKDPEAASSDFRHLRHMAPKLQRQFLEICRAIVLADEIVTVAEAELYRLVGLLIAVPMPALAAPDEHGGGARSATRADG